MKQKSVEGTFLASVVMSSPGPIMVGAALFFGRSSTQLADFIRRTAELVAIIVSWIVFRILHKKGEPDAAYKNKLEHITNLCVGVAMCLSGAAMLFIALFSHNAKKGNVIPGLVIAVLGVTTNSWFWLRYRKLNREKPDRILSVQSRLYRAKSLVDACVITALTVVAYTPASFAARYADLGGSIIVAAYLIANGIITIRGTNTEANYNSSLP
ncbi:MAG: putative rane transporter [Eubacterium sp.]|nr:putative rane transporter [Eubacterium sp.]